MNALKDLFYFTYKEKRALIALLVISLAIGSSFFIFDEEGTMLRANDTIPLPHPQKLNQQLKGERRPSAQQGKYEYQPKYKKGVLIDLNHADTSELKMIPGIGTTTAKRIVQYKNKLGGYYSINQLYEIRGIDSVSVDKFQSWLHIPKADIEKIPINQTPYDSLAKHPYLSFKQSKAIQYLLKHRSKIRNWTELMMLEEFTENDKQRLIHYLSFE
ncbi:MAG: ComEA family DNA-binding protein [Tannerellaceae bacterium]